MLRGNHQQQSQQATAESEDEEALRSGNEGFHYPLSPWFWIREKRQQLSHHVPSRVYLHARPPVHRAHPRCATLPGHRLLRWHIMQCHLHKRG
ncbi:hypothetical protein MTO96_037064 [Rhipicephalus appendiculatus]